MSAVFSQDRVYRYYLERTVHPLLTNLMSVCFVMLNPSTTDELHPDPTITKCLGFASRWGMGTLRVVNLFALKSTDPRALKRHDDPVGPENDAWIDKVVAQASLVVLAWGNHGALHGRGDIVKHRVLKARRECHAFRFTKAGQPEHPLMMPYAQQLAQMEEKEKPAK